MSPPRPPAARLIPPQARDGRGRCGAVGRGWGITHFEQLPRVLTQTRSHRRGRGGPRGLPAMLPTGTGPGSDSEHVAAPGEGSPGPWWLPSASQHGGGQPCGQTDAGPNLSSTLLTNHMCLSV